MVCARRDPVYVEVRKGSLALFSYAGLVPWVRESTGHNSRGGTCRCGSPRLRWVMVEAAHTAIRSSPAARECFER
jgi:transposase